MINEVLRLKGLYVYVKKGDIKLDSDEYLDSDLIGLDVVVDGNISGVVKDITNTGNNKLLVISKDSKNIYIPYQKAFIKEIDLENNKIVIEPIEGMF